MEEKKQSVFLLTAWGSNLDVGETDLVALLESLADLILALRSGLVQPIHELHHTFDPADDAPEVDQQVDCLQSGKRARFILFEMCPEPVLVKSSFVMPAGIVMRKKERKREREKERKRGGVSG